MSEFALICLGFSVALGALVGGATGALWALVIVLGLTIVLYLASGLVD